MDFFRSAKLMGGDHGIGLKSVSDSIKKYGGDLRLNYDENVKLFTAMIMMPLINN